MITPPRNVLCSYHYFKDYDLDRLPNLRIIGDSGAFSAESQGATITTKDLAGWATKWAHRLAWVASLDVIGDQDGTRRNWQDMVEDHGVPGIPTIHYGAHPSAMDWYVDRDVDFIGLGGMVGRPLVRQMRWLIGVFKYQQANHPGLRFHGWGVTADKVLNLPFYSVDSSGWTSAVRFGRVILRDPRTGKDYPIDLNGRDAYRPEVATLLRDIYGVSVRDAATSSGANRETIIRISALSVAVQEARARRKHGTITSPSWGRLAGTADGPILHLATAGSSASNASPEHIENLNRSGGASVGPHLHLVDARPGRSDDLYPKLDAMHEETP